MKVESASTESRRSVQFGPFTLDIPAGELHKNGSKIRIPEQPFQVLLLLLDRPGEVVTREELQQKLWPADTFVDFEHSINAAVKRLREALGDSADSPRFIETLPRRGYRFLCPINVAQADEAQTEIPPRPAWWRRPRLVVAFTVTAVLGALLVLNVAGLRARLFGRGEGEAIRSLAVLPLENLTGEADQEYLVDGIHDEFVTQMAQISSLDVTSRTSVLPYKHPKKPLPEIAREINVDGIVEGAVSRKGSRIHVSVQLIAADKDRHLWANSYDRELGDLQNLAPEVARAIAGRLNLKLTPLEQSLLSDRNPTSPEAYKLYLTGTYYGGKWMKDALGKAINYFQQALDLDPAYAPAWSAMGTAYERGGSPPGINLSREDRLLRAKDALERAVKLDPTLRAPHQALARIKVDEWDWAGATREFQRARELDPEFVPSVYMMFTGRFNEAIAAAQRQSRLNPLGYATQLTLGITYFKAGRFDESIAQLKKTISLDPANHMGHFELAWNYAQKGMHQEAIRECETSLALRQKREPNAFYVEGCGPVYAMAGRRREALEFANKLETAGEGPHRFIQIAHIYDALGDSDRALAYLSKAYAEREAKLPEQLYNPTISDRLRADPRFQELIRRTGIPWATFPLKRETQAVAVKATKK
jgi:TolB-like protein/DNA-binding winged helix-turn-helix (wHTH) protein